MTRPPKAREKALRAYARLLHTDGERSATVDAVAAQAGVSKGGVLYHFPSKDALGEGLIELFTEAVAVDTARMADDADGPARHYLRTSWETDHELDELYGAVLRLAQASWQPAVEALEATHAGWMALIRKDVGDRHAAEAIMLIGEGLYHQSLMPGTWSRELFRDSLDHLLDLVDRLKENR